MWSKRGLYSSPWRWVWLVVLLVAVLCDLSPQTGPFDQLKTELLRLKTQVGELQSKINDLDEALQKADLSSKDLERTINALTTLRDEQQQKINALAMNYEGQLKASRELETLVQTLQTQLSESQTSLKRLKELLQDQTNRTIGFSIGAGITGLVIGIVTGYAIWNK